MALIITQSVLAEWTKVDQTINAIFILIYQELKKKTNIYLFGVCLTLPSQTFRGE